MKELVEQYLKNLTKTLQRGDAREESYYKYLDDLIRNAGDLLGVKNIDITILPKNHEYHKTGKGRDPIIHFYEKFLATYVPEIRERRGVYYTPEAVVGYIVRSIYSILKSHFGLADGLPVKKQNCLIRLAAH